MCHAHAWVWNTSLLNYFIPNHGTKAISRDFTSCGFECLCTGSGIRNIQKSRCKLVQKNHIFNKQHPIMLKFSHNVLKAIIMICSLAHLWAIRRKGVIADVCSQFIWFSKAISLLICVTLMRESETPPYSITSYRITARKRYHATLLYATFGASDIFDTSS